MNTQQSVQSPIEGALSKILELFMFSKMKQLTKGKTLEFFCNGVKNIRCLEGWGK